jgi:acetyl-CoA acetyltransferase
MVADPLRLLEICATSDGGAALVLTSMDFARRHAGGAEPLVTIDAVSTVTPTFPNTVIEMPNFSTDSAAATGAQGGSNDGAADGAAAAAAAGFRPSIATAAYAEAGIGPEDVSLAEVYDLSSALELDWYEDIGLCGEGEAEKLLRDGATTLGGRVPVNPSGGLSCFGEAIPAQAIAQVCECVWQLRGTATGHQVEGARVAVTANQGLFGHGSSVLLSR